jgi:[ribosomal protein S5]-alanine N-acetyltransferase
MIQAPEIFRTKSLVLRRPKDSDAAAIYEYASDPEVTRYMVWRTATELRETVEVLATRAPAWESGEEFVWVLTIQPEDRVIGAIACRVEDAAADIGYVLNRHFWGQGYATEAAQAVVDWAMSLPGINRVWATCDVDNLASARVLEKVGLALEETQQQSLVRPNISEEPRDALVFAKLQSPE